MNSDLWSHSIAIAWFRANLRFASTPHVSRCCIATADAAASDDDGGDGDGTRLMCVTCAAYIHICK